MCGPCPLMNPLMPSDARVLQGRSKRAMGLAEPSAPARLGHQFLPPVR